MAKLQNVRGTYDLYGEAKRKMKKVTSVGSEVVEKYGFEEGEDFSPILANLTESTGRPKKEYVIKMDMAKELAMVENNEKRRKKWN